MEKKFHVVDIRCPHCNQKATILEVLSSGDGEIMFDLACIPCGKELTWITNSPHLIRKAILGDLLENEVQHNPAPLEDGLAFDEMFLTGLKISRQKSLPLDGRIHE